MTFDFTKTAKILLTSTALTLTPYVGGAMEDKENNLQDSTPQSPTPMNTQNDNTPPPPTTQIQTTTVKPNFYGQTESIAEKLTIYGIPLGFNFVEVSRSLVNTDKSELPQWQSEYVPISAAVEIILKDLANKFQEQRQEVELFYRESKDLNQQRAAKPLISIFNLADDKLAPTQLMLSMMDAFSEYAFEKAALYEVEKDTQTKEILKSYIQAHGKTMFMALLSAHGVCEKIKNDRDALLRQIDILNHLKKQKETASGEILKKKNTQIQNQESEITQANSALESLEKTLLESLRAPNISRSVFRSSWIHLNEALQGKKSEMSTDRGKKTESVYNPNIVENKIAPIATWFMNSIVSDRGEEFTSTDFTRRDIMLEFLFNEKQNMTEGSFKALVELKIKRLETSKQKEEIKVENISESKIETTQQSSGGFLSYFWGKTSTTTSLIEMTKEESALSNPINTPPLNTAEDEKKDSSFQAHKGDNPTIPSSDILGDHQNSGESISKTLQNSDKKQNNQNNTNDNNKIPEKSNHKNNSKQNNSGNNPRNNKKK